MKLMAIGVYPHKSGVDSNRYVHGMCGTRLYRIWVNIKTRCHNSNYPRFKDYGGRGITVCDEWKNDFKSFYDWSINNGYSDELTIDRIDNDKGYSPENCRWVTYSANEKNKSTSNIITFNGKTQNLIDWARETGINHRTICQRLKYGWSIEDALTKAVIRK